MGGSQLGLSHIHAAARHRSFVEEADTLRALRLAEAAQSGSGASPMMRLRRTAGAFLICLGEHVKGGRVRDAEVAPAAGLRLAR